MRTKHLYTWLLLAAMCLFGAGCQTLEEDVSVEDCGVLKVKARSVQTEEAIYPMYLYAFSEEGACASSSKLVFKKKPLWAIGENNANDPQCAWSMERPALQHLY